MFALIFRIIKLAFLGLVIVAAFAMANDPTEESWQELLVPAEPWVIRRHNALREGTIPSSSHQTASSTRTVEAVAVGRGSRPGALSLEGRHEPGQVNEPGLLGVRPGRPVPARGGRDAAPVGDAR